MIPLSHSNLQKSVQVPPQHDALELTKNGNTATIRLGDQLYTLRITKSGKLILTK